MVPDRDEVPANNREAVKCASFAVCVSKVHDTLVTPLDAKFCEGFLIISGGFFFLVGCLG